MFRPSAFSLHALPLLILATTAAQSNAADVTFLPAPLIAPDGGKLAPGASTVFTLQVPERNSRERNAEGEWRSLVSLDLYGTLGADPAKITIEAIDPENGDVMGSGASATGEQPTPGPWAAIASSDSPQHPAINAFRGGRNEWISQSKEGEEDWIGLVFGQPMRMTGIDYIPRTYSRGAGLARKYRVEIRPPGGEWETIITGERRSNYTSALKLPFPEPATVEAFRFVIETDLRGSHAGSASRINLHGINLPERQRVLAPARAWAEIPPDATARIEGRSIHVRVRNDSTNGVAIGEPRFARIHLAPDRSLQVNRPHRNRGPDRLGAGLLGFEALTEQSRNVLSLMAVKPDLAAQEQGLRQGDVIIAVAGNPLPLNHLAAGWDWFRYSHEAVIGRAQEAALKAGENTLPITIMRDGKPVEVAIPLNREAAFTTLNPLDDPEAARMLEDCLGFLVRSQRDDGSWERCMIRTSFAALAMLATGEEEHIERARKAVDWAKRRYREPSRYGNLGFWHGAYAGILYSEWHLATGDTSVMLNLEDLRDWVVGGQKDSAFGIPALGHGTGGLPYQRRGLVAPACHLLVFEAIAMRGGMESAIWELILPYMEMAWSNPAEGGHGALGYHGAHRDQSEFWSRSGLFAMAAHLRGERPDMRDAMIHIMHQRHPWLRNSHAYGEPGGATGLLALNLCAPEIFAEVMGHYAWWFSLAWEPSHGLRYTTPHKGAPYLGGELLINATYALVLQGPLRSLHLTGKAE